MPIYAYRCASCGHAKDVIQKFSDTPLSICPECGADAFRKQLTAPAFQLKGSGWYVTDFRDGGRKPAAKDASAPAAGGEAAPAKAAEPAASGSAAGASPAPGAPAPAAPKAQSDT